MKGFMCKVLSLSCLLFLLAACQTPSGTEKWTRDLVDPNPDVREAAAVALRQQGSRTAVPALGAALDDRFIRVRVAAAEALEAMGPRALDVVIPLALHLSDPAERVRAACRRTLKSLGPEAVPPLDQALKSPSESERAAAAKALEILLPPAKASQKDKYALIEALRDPDESVRMSAARALGKMGPSAREAIPALEALVADPDIKEETREAASKALDRVAGR